MSDCEKCERCRFDGCACCCYCMRVFAPPRLPTSREEAFLAAVLVELKRAREKHPGGKHLCVALGEEVGELHRAHLDDEGQDRIYEEAVQVAVVAARIAIDGDEDFRKDGSK
jgi:hypothetical protein